MRSRLAFQNSRMQLNISAPGQGGTTLIVRWDQKDGGSFDPTTGGLAGASVVAASGTLRGFVYEEPGQSVLRMNAEIQTGDLIIECLPDAPVTLLTILPGITSATLPLAQLDSPIFELNGQRYSQSKVGRELKLAWDTTQEDAEGNVVRLERTIVLRPET